MSGAVSAGAPREVETSAAPDLWWPYFGDWLRRAHQVVSASADVLNRLNVFPVSDSDTGTNVELTLAGMVEALPASGPIAADDLVRAAVLSAHGNSGAIVAEMMISVAREAGRPRTGSDPGPGSLVAHLLRVAARAATRAVARPVAGTILTVADDAARSAEIAAETTPDDAAVVVEAAQRAAAESLARTPELLDVLAEAGVVDAGGQAYVLLIDVLSEMLGGDPAEPVGDAAPSAASDSSPTGVEPEVTYEVMYALRGAGPDALTALRGELSEWGGSVVVVGDETVAQVHVHLADAGAAVEAGMARGALSQVRISVLPTTPATTDRTVVAVVAGPGLADAVAALGGVAVRPADSHVTLEELAVILDRDCGDVVILPNDMESLEFANHLAASRRGPGRRVAVIPTTAQVQGLAALAVHEPSADFDSAVVAMSSTAGHARHGAVTIAETAAMTMAGRCEVGDVLGLLDGDFVEIGSSVPEVAERIISRLTAGGGELLTLIAGADAQPELVEQLRRRHDPGLDVEVVDGGQRRYLLLIGIE